MKVTCHTCKTHPPKRLAGVARLIRGMGGVWYCDGCKQRASKLAFRNMMRRKGLG